MEVFDNTAHHDLVQRPGRVGRHEIGYPVSCGKKIHPLRCDRVRHLLIGTRAGLSQVKDLINTVGLPLRDTGYLDGSVCRSCKHRASGKAKQHHQHHAQPQAECPFAPFLHPASLLSVHSFNLPSLPCPFLAVKKNRPSFPSLTKT